jgi:hypothetical protein
MSDENDKPQLPLRLDDWEIVTSLYWEGSAPPKQLDGPDWYLVTISAVAVVRNAMICGGVLCVYAKRKVKP